MDRNLSWPAVGSLALWKMSRRDAGRPFNGERAERWVKDEDGVGDEWANG